MSHATYLVGDVFDRLKELPDASVDLVVTSPPFLALRSYLPADHPDKHKEIGSEPTPAAFIDVMLALSAELRRVLAPHGSIAVELGDTYCGAGGYGSPDSPNPAYGADSFGERWEGRSPKRYKTKDDGWPLAKSKTLIPELYRLALAYGINPLTGQQSPAGQWRIRNVVTWCRPNPPVGALGDKWRPATSDIVVACVSGKRFWDDIATRREHKADPDAYTGNGYSKGFPNGIPGNESMPGNTHGAPLLDYWEIPPGGYSGKTLTVHREPCGPDDGGERKVSPDCPVHADLPGQLPKALRDARAGSRATGSGHSDDRPAQGQLIGSAPTDPHSEQETEGESSDSPHPVGDPTATPHDKGSSRTGRAPGTSPSGTPSAQTTDRIAGKPESPEYVEHRPDIPVSSTSADDSPDSPELQSPDRTADNDTEPESSEACTCSYSKVVKEEYTSHYAVYPPSLIVPLIKAMAPPKVCRTCGEPSRRIVGEADYVGPNGEDRNHDALSWESGGAIGNRGSSVGRTDGGITAIRPTLGFTDCGHNNYRPALVLDPFAGSGTTLMVATGHGHDAIGIDLDERNADLARERIGDLFLTVKGAA